MTAREQITEELAAYREGDGDASTDWWPSSIPSFGRSRGSSSCAEGDPLRPTGPRGLPEAGRSQSRELA